MHKIFDSKNIQLIILNTPHLSFIRKTFQLEKLVHCASKYNYRVIVKFKKKIIYWYKNYMSNIVQVSTTHQTSERRVCMGGGRTS